MITQVILPMLGETMNQGTIVEWLKGEGDPVQRGDPIFSVETDKTTLEVEANAQGILRKILVPAGTAVPVLSPVALIAGTMDEDISEANVEGARVPGLGAVGSGAVPEIPQPEIAPLAGGRVFASPRARMRAKELGVDLAQAKGSGPSGRIVEKDVLAYAASVPKVTPVAAKMAAEWGLDLKSVMGTGAGGRITKEDVEAAHLARTEAGPRALAPAAVPARTAAPTLARGPAQAPAPVPVVKLPLVEVAATQPMAGLRGIIASRMATSAQTTARVTLMTEVDATALVEVRTQLKNAVTEAWGFAPGYNDLLGLIAARALHEFPYMNARLNGDAIEQLAHVNVGLAVDTERGLLVTVIRDADKKGLRQFGEEFRALVERARVGKSLPDDLTGGTFTITNLGMFGIDAFTPIINLPEAAILGVGRIVARPVVQGPSASSGQGGQIVVRQMVTLSLAFDHRLTDGAPAARFLQRIGQLVEQPYLLLG